MMSLQCVDFSYAGFLKRKRHLMRFVKLVFDIVFFVFRGLRLEWTEDRAEVTCKCYVFLFIRPGPGVVLLS